MIQSLYISYNHNEYPTIVTDSYDSLLNYSFGTTNVYTIKLNNFNMVLSYLDYSVESKVNKPATFLYRTYSNDYEYSTLYGNCLIFDSQNNNISSELIRNISTIYNNI
jgi:hypothetical protein